MPSKKQRKECAICHKVFAPTDVYPLSLVRHTVLTIAKTKYPQLEEESFVCYPDLRKMHALYFEEVMKQERGALSQLEKDVLQNISEHEILSENINEQFEETLTVGDRIADKIAQFGGSWTFILLFGIVLFSWMGVNSFQYLQGSFDPYPYIFLNLVLSCLAAIQAPVIMMSQNRQSAKDRLSQEKDYQINLKSELQIRQLNARLELFMKHHWQKMHELSRMQEEIVHEVEDKAPHSKP